MSIVRQYVETRRVVEKESNAERRSFSRFWEIVGVPWQKGVGMIMEHLYASAY